MSFLKRFLVCVLVCVCVFGQQAQAQLLTGYTSGKKEPASPSYQQPYQPAPSYRQAAVNTGTYQQAYEQSTPSGEVPVDLSADQLRHEEASRRIIASGDVEITQAGRTIRADEVIYDMANDQVMAKGNVVLHEPNGDVHFAEEVSLTNQMKSGFVYGLQSYLAEGGRFTADKGERQNAEKVVMSNAAYTPCDCEADENGNPAWQIRAQELTYHEDEHRISYKNARFEIFGIPTLWTPYLSHPDGQIKRKSGVLSPTFGYDSELGLVVTPRYYWDIEPHRDATLGLMMTTQEYPVVLGEYRHRFTDAEILMDGSVSYSARTDTEAGQEVAKPEELRGHLFGKGTWDINQKYRAGFDLEMTSDSQYLRQFDLSGKNLLENELYVERFSGRNYAVARALAFEDTRIDLEQVDQPNIMPEVVATFYGEPNELLGGRWMLGASALGLVREGGGQDVDRLVLEAGWQKRTVFTSGIVTTLDTLARGDFYRTNDRTVAFTGSGRSGAGTGSRTYARANLEASYPLVKQYERSQAVIEPVAAVTVSPNINSGDENIPNEDSQDVQLDASNVFNPNRFPGKDRIEDDTHITYGLRSGLYGDDGSHINIFLGQSYRFDKQQRFPEGSGLSRQSSDYVGQITGRYRENYAVNYRFQLGSDDFSSQRHELDASADWDRISLDSRYLFAKRIAGIEGNESREQVEMDAAFNLTQRWRLRSGALYDLGEDPGLRKARLGLDYAGCCMSFSLAAERSLTADSSGESGTDVMLRLGLKNIGEFQNMDDRSSFDN